MSIITTLYSSTPSAVALISHSSHPFTLFCCPTMLLTCSSFILAACVAFAYAHPPSSYRSPYNGKGAGSDAPQIFFGRFISTPAPDQLLIQQGAVLVSSGDGRGFINAVAWNVSDPGAAITALGAASGTTIITSDDQGFFFPGFIGMMSNETDNEIN